MTGGWFDLLFPGLETRVLGATPMFWVRVSLCTRCSLQPALAQIPGSREICLWMGAIDANRRTAANVLKKGLSLMVRSRRSGLTCMHSACAFQIYPGGSKEIFLTDPTSKDTVLVSRKGADSAHRSLEGHA